MRGRPTRTGAPCGARGGGATLAGAIATGPRRADTLYAVYHGAFWLAPGMFFPFFYPLLVRRGVTEPQLGVVAAALPLCALLAQPAVGWLCDRTGRGRGILCLLTLLSALVLPLFSAVRGFGAELGVAVVFSVFNTPLAPLGDALTISYLGPRGQRYGRLRLWGSLTFALAGIGAGLAMGAGALGTRQAFLLGAVLWVPPALLPLWFPLELQQQGAPERWTRDPDAAPAAPPRGGRDVRTLLRAGPLLSLLGFATLNMLALDAHNTYFSVYLARLGGGPAAQGFGWALPAVLEAPCFLGSAALGRRLGGGKTLLIAFACEVAALTGIALAPGAWWAVAAMTMQGPAFALFYGAAVPMIDRLAPAGWRASSQTLLWASCFGLGGVVAGLAGGWLVGAVGLVGLYRALALFSGVAAGLFWVGGRGTVAAAAHP